MPVLTRCLLVIMVVLLPAHAAAAERMLVAFGTSLTAGGSWPDELASAIGAGGGETLNVRRVAAGGVGSDWGLASVDKVIALKPDLVLVEFAINDADIRNLTTLARSEANHRAIIMALRSALPAVMIALVTTNPAFGPRGWIRPQLAQYYALYHRIAATEGVHLIDAYPRWDLALAQGDRRRLLPDGVHPTAEASREIFLPVVTAAVAAMLRSPPPQ
jgi:lysophospholipase L1-like esterase